MKCTDQGWGLKDVAGTMSCVIQSNTTAELYEVESGNVDMHNECAQ